MRWRKFGLVYGPDGSLPWARHSALTPTPFRLPDGAVRVYAGFRDDFGRSRIGFVDVDPEMPTRVLRVSPRPVINLGEPGAFDANGMILGDVVSVGDVVRMYYVGFQKSPHHKFLAFTGLAESRDGGESFRRVTTLPVLGGTKEGRTIRALHTVRCEGGAWQAWYAIGSGWETIDGAPYPRYRIVFTESEDGIRFPEAGQAVIDPVGDEYRIGRPRVVGGDGSYRMLYTVGTLRKTYLPGYATSLDGVAWIRRDREVGIGPSGGDAWDSEHLSYLAPIELGGRTLAFYNGNNMGYDGFGVAEIESW